MMRLFIFLFVLIVGNSHRLIASAISISYRDSLAARLSLMPDDSVKVKKLLQLSEEMSWTDVYQAETYASMALKISEALQYTWGLAHSKYQVSLLFKDSDIRIAETFILEALEHASKINDSLLIGRIYNTIGNLKDFINEPEEAVTYYKKSMEIFEILGNDSLKGSIYNNLGIISDNLGEYPKAIEYYRMAAELNKKRLRLSNLAINFLNMGYSMILSGNLDSALYYLDNSHNLASQFNYRRLLPYIYNNYSEYYFRKKGFAKAISYAQKAELNAKEQDNLRQEKQALIMQKNAYLALNQLPEALQCSERINVISDSINSYGKLKEIDLLEMRFAFEKERTRREMEQQILQADLKRRKMAFKLVIISAVAVVILLIILYLWQLNRNRRKELERKTTLLEKEKLAKELDYKNKQLTTNVMYLLKKNEFISDISEKLKNVGKSESFDSHLINRIVVDLNKSTQEDSWTEFEKRFQDVHTGFYQKLSKHYPELTPYELRLCAFLRLNMTSKEIADITFQSVDSLKTARYRLRKKLGLDRESNLVSFLTQF